MDRARGRRRLRSGGLRGRGHPGRKRTRGRPCDQQGAGARSVAGRPVDVAGGRPGAGAGARGGDAVGLERPGDGGGRPPQGRRLDGAVHQPTRPRRARRTRAGAGFAPRAARRGRQGTALCHGARLVRGQAERAPRGRPGPGAGVDQLQPPAAVPDLRRHRPGPRGRQRARGAAGQRLVQGPARLRGRQSCRLRGSAGAAGPARGDDRRRRRPRPEHRHLLDRLREWRPGRRPLRRPADRPPPGDRWPHRLRGGGRRRPGPAGCA